MAPEPRTARTRRWAANGLLLGIGLLLAEAVAQVVGSVGPASVRLSRIHAEQRLLHEREGRQEATPGPLRPGFEVLHPFVGYVNRPGGAGTAGESAGPSEHGFPDLQRVSPDDFVIAVFGGSVAAWMVKEARETLVSALPDEIVRGRRVVVQSLALGGYKQPQQLMALNYFLVLGERVDAVINVDGFNEVALTIHANVTHQVFPLYPRSWFPLVSPLASPPERLAVGALAHVRQQRGSLARRFLGSPTRHSAVAAFVWRALDHGLAVRELEAERELAATMSEGRSFAARGPRRFLGSDREAVGAAVDAWARASVQMHRICAANGIPYVHLLQPNQYVPGSKPMGAAERAVAFDENHPYRRGVEMGYPLLVRAGGELRAAGVPFVDLHRLFATTAETRYSDRCCHLTVEGSRELARRAGREVGAVLSASAGTSRKP
jgi:hypothetical protein